MYPAVFLDRDGVIIENRPAYVRSWSEVAIFPQALAALSRLRDSHYKVILVTNQSAVGRGILPLVAAEDINRRLVREIESVGGRIDGVFMCPHAPEDDCECRKPEPGLFFQAARTLSIDLGHSIMIGDALTDLMAAQRAGIQKRILVQTGRGAEQANLPEAKELQPFLLCQDLAGALADLI